MGGGGRPRVVALVLVAASLLECLVVAAATSHTVGSSTGWTIPSSSTFYPDWASTQSFAVGDTLVFNFQTGSHDVIEVPESGYTSCSASNQIGSNITTGPATVTITRAGQHFYICGFPGHCAANQKLAITVSSSTTRSPAGSPLPSATSPTGSVPGTNAASSLPSGVRVAATFSALLSFAYFLL